MSRYPLRRLFANARHIARGHARRFGMDPNDPAVSSAAGAGLAIALANHIPTRGSVLTLAYHTIRGQLTAARRNVDRHRRLLPLDADAGAQREPAPQRDLGFEARLEVRRSLQKLPPLSRNVVCLRVVGGYSLSDISRKVGRARSTVCKIFDAAMEQLRQELAP